MILKPFVIENHHHAALLFLKHFSILHGNKDLSFIQKLLRAFSQIPYENISKRIKMNTIAGEWDRLRLPEEVFHSFLEHGFGGTCYSLTYFLWVICDYCSFQCYPITMNMKWADNAHCGLVIEHENKLYLLDPGYLLSKPIPLNQLTSIHTIDQHTGVQLIYHSLHNKYELFTYSGNNKTFRYSFQLNKLFLEDFLLAWKSSFYQKTNRHICLTKIDPVRKGRIYIRDQFIRFYNEGKKENIKMDMKQGIKTFFGISPEWIDMAQKDIYVS